MKESVFTDLLRGRGLVEVECSKPDCGWSFWVEALDPRLPGGPFLCPGSCDGSKHVYQKAQEPR